MTSPLSAELDEVLEPAADDLRAQRGARILITGASGFVGSCLLESIAWSNARLGTGIRAVALTRNPAAAIGKLGHLFPNSGLELARGDVRALSPELGSFDGVVHAATPTSSGVEGRPLELFAAAIDGGRSVLELTRMCGSIPFLLTSSGAVYGRQPECISRLTEDSCFSADFLEPSNAYQEGKRTLEFTSLLYADEYGVRAKIARLFAFVGPYLPLDRNFAAGNFIADALAGRPITLSGDGTTVRSYLYAFDMVAWLWAIYARGEVSRPYNVGASEEIDMRSLATLVAEVAGSEAGIRVLGETVPGKRVDRYVPSNARIVSELGVREYVALPDALRRMLAFNRMRSG
jgi:dTDP-glucose 4,6-dehydratase